MYYFQAVNFKRSGTYLVSFHVEGAEFCKVKPLYYPVRVESKSIKYGAKYALTQLRAQSFINNPGRQNLSGKRDFLNASDDTSDECEAVKNCLLTFYFALPVGSIVMGQDLKSNENLFDSISEAVGWNDIIDQMWREQLTNARSALKLMEFLLVLEFYINKSWLTSAQRLFNALPNAHFAIRCASYSSVALRIYALDMCMSYEKVQSLPRAQRSSVAIDYPPTKKAEPAASVPVPQKRTRPPPTNRYATDSDQSASEENENSDESDEDDDASSEDASASDGSGGRRSKRPSRAAANKRSRASPAARRPPRRAAAVTASRKLRDADSDDSDEGARRPTISNVPTSGGASRQTYQWVCTFCSCLNEMRARSCITCDSRKSANAELKPDSTEIPSHNEASSTTVKKTSRNRVVQSDSDEDENASQSHPDGKWECLQCTYLNEQRARSCEICTCKKPTGAVSGSTRRQAKQSTQDELGFDVELPYQADKTGYVDFVKLILDNRESLSAATTRENQLMYDLKARGCYILRAFQFEPKCVPFWYPVDLEEYTDYLSHVSYPMDLLTITQKLVAGIYGSNYDNFKAVSYFWHFYSKL